MDYEEAEKLNLLGCERKCADQILQALKRCKQEKIFKLDKLTLGDGSCCMTAILQQMSRPDLIFIYLSSSQFSKLFYSIQISNLP